MKDYLINSITTQQFNSLKPSMKEEISRLRREMGAYDPDIADIWEEVDRAAYDKAMAQVPKKQSNSKPKFSIGASVSYKDDSRHEKEEYRVIEHLKGPRGPKYKMSSIRKPSSDNFYIADESELISYVPKTCQILDSEGKPDISPKAIKVFEKCSENLPQTKTLHTDAKGNYTPERQKLHRRIIDSFKKEKKCVTQRQPVAILTGGPPGSGKSTWLKKFLPWATKDRVYHIDADEVRATLPEYKGWNATSTHLEAKDIVNDLIEDIGDPCEYDLIYDGTMNKATSYEPLLAQLRRLGYKIFIIYISVPEKVSRKRVLERYRKSGRYVPMHVIDEVYERGLGAFEKLAKEADGYIMVNGETGKIMQKGGMAMPTEERYLKADDCKTCATSIKPKAKGISIGGLDIDRKDMPQIRTPKKAAFFKWLQQQGVEYHTRVVPASSLKPTQKHIDPAKLELVGEMDPQLRKKPIMVSKDGYVLDGHHRWAYAKDRGQNIAVVQIDKDIKPLIALIKQWPEAEYSSLSYQTPATKAAAKRLAEKKAKPKVVSNSVTKIEKPGLFAVFGNKKVEINSFEDASKKWLKFLDKVWSENGGWPKEMRSSADITNEKGEVVGHISQNGRIWEGKEYKSGQKPVYDPYAKTLPNSLQDPAKQTLKEYQKNEANNAHIENLVLLSFLYGKPEEHELAKDLNRDLEKHGFARPERSQEWAELDAKASKWYRQLQKDAGEKPDALPPKMHANKTIEKKTEAAIHGNKGWMASQLTKAKRGDFKHFTMAQVLEKAQAFQRARSKASQTRDGHSDSKKRLSPTPENLVRWMNNPGGFDLIGVDTFKKDDPTANLRIKLETWWNAQG